MMRISVVLVDVKEKYQEPLNNVQIRNRMDSTQKYSFREKLFINKLNEDISYLYINAPMYVEIVAHEKYLTKIKVFTFEGMLLNQMRLNDKEILRKDYPSIVPSILAIAIIRELVLDNKPMKTLNTVKTNSISLVNNALRDDQRLLREKSFNQHLR